MHQSSVITSTSVKRHNQSVVENRTMGNQIEEERLLLKKANDKIRRCQIALFRFQKNHSRYGPGLNEFSKHSGAETSLGIGPFPNTSQSINLSIKRDKLKT